MERFYRRRLPHFRIDRPGMLYFVTWRIARRQPPLTEIERNIVVDCLRYWDGMCYRLEAFVGQPLDDADAIFMQRVVAIGVYMT